MKEEEYLTEKEFCEKFKVSLTTAWRLRKEGIPHGTIGSKVIFNEKEVWEWMKNNSVKNC
jgi:predicted DNA-binding transcriptional regulator AlpA